MQQVSLRDYCEEARSLIQSGEPDMAIHITRHILRLHPRHVDSYRVLAQALLATGNNQEASRQFRRVLSADPEDVTARLGLAEIHRAKGDLDKAIWQMRRAIDLLPGDSDLRLQLRRLIDARPGDDTSEQPEITRAALGRIYARSGLYAKSIQEFKAVLAENPARTDVEASLAEVLWRAGRHLQAGEACQRVLERLPNALKANLIVGALWLENSQPDEAQPHLGLARALDPENIVAQSLFGDKSPLSPITVTIERLGEDEIEDSQLKPPPTSPDESWPVSQRLEPAADWMSPLHEEDTTPMMSNEERPDEEFELPEWLQGVGDDLLEEDDAQAVASSASEHDAIEDDETPDWLGKLVARAEESRDADESPPTEPDEGADWLQELSPEVPEEAPTEPEPESSPTPTASEAQQPDWEELPEEQTRSSVVEPLGESDVPDWLREIAAGEMVPPEEEVEPPVTAAETLSEVEVDETDLPDWLRDFEGPIAEGDGSEIQPLSLEAAEEPTVEAGAGRALWEQILAEEGVDLDTAEEMLPSEAEGMSAEEWLRSTADLAQTPSRPAPPEPEPERAGAESDEAGLPDWLRQVAAGEAEPAEEAEPLTPMAESEAPDWLRELQEPAAEMQPSAEEEYEEEGLEVEVDEAGLPDWLRQPSVEAAESVEPEVLPAEHEVLPAEHEVLPAEHEAGPPAEMPDWLTELEAEEMMLEEPAFEEPIELETGEMPAWLSEVMAEESPLSVDWAAESEMAVPAEAEAQEDQVPDWLRPFREQEEVEIEPAIDTLELEAALEAEEQPEEAAQPVLPDWLRRLREGVPDTEPPAPEEYAAPEAEELPAEAPVEVEAAPPVEALPEPEPVQAEAAGPEWLGELVRDEESLAELESIEEEISPGEALTPTPVEYIEVAEAEVPSAALPETEPEPVEAAEPPITKPLEPLRAEDLPKDPDARLAMARAALNAGDWSEALIIYETLVTSSDLLDSVIDDIKVGIRRHADDATGYQVLGDACMKDGRLHEALQAYRTALTKL